jgi:hypothetical protein
MQQFVLRFVDRITLRQLQALEMLIPHAAAKMRGTK